MSEQLKTQNKLDFYRSYIGKNISIYNKQWKVTDARKLNDDTILMYYGIKTGAGIGGTGIINSVIAKDIETGKFLDDMEKEN